MTSCAAVISIPGDAHSWIAVPNALYERIVRSSACSAFVVGSFWDTVGSL